MLLRDCEYIPFLCFPYSFISGTHPYPLFSIFPGVANVKKRDLDLDSCIMWIRDRTVRKLSIVSNDSDFNPSARPSVVKIANHC